MYNFVITFYIHIFVLCNYVHASQVPYQYFSVAVNAEECNITLTHDGPVVLGGTITFKADIFINGERPSGQFKYKFEDNSLTHHEYEVGILIVLWSLWKLIAKLK